MNRMLFAMAAAALIAVISGSEARADSDCRLDNKTYDGSTLKTATVVCGSNYLGVVSGPVYGGQYLAQCTFSSNLPGTSMSLQDAANWIVRNCRPR